MSFDASILRYGLEGLAGPLTGDSVAGLDLEYDPDFMSLSAAMASQSASMIDSEDEQESGPDWRDLYERAVMLGGRSRDLRINARLSQCALEEHGVGGLAAALALFKSHLSDFWMDVHPLPDADDNYDVTARYNALMSLNDGAVVRALSRVPLLRPKGVGPISLISFDLANGKRSASSDEISSSANESVAAISSLAGTDAVKLLVDDISSSLSSALAIEDLWNAGMVSLEAHAMESGDEFSGGDIVKLDALTTVLKDIQRYLRNALPEVESEALEADADQLGEGLGGAPAVLGAINSRVDASAAISNVIHWFEQNEPSSPVSAMLTRARSMISKSFLEIVEELGEAGIVEARKSQSRIDEGDGSDS